MKKSKVFEQILNGLVLLGSLAIIIVASIELLDGNNALSETFILKFHLWVCGLFLADFFVRWSCFFHLWKPDAALGCGRCRVGGCGGDFRR